jgi:hypothetical protein
VKLMSDVDAYFEGIVRPTVEEFAKAPASRRRAFLACVTLFHTVDYLAARPKSPNKRELRRRFRANKYFAIVDRVAHAFKHVQTGDDNSPSNKHLSAHAVFSRPPCFAGVMVAGLSYLNDTRGGVEIWNEREFDLLYVIKQASEFLCGEIERTKQLRR